MTITALSTKDLIIRMLTSEAPNAYFVEYNRRRAWLHGKHGSYMPFSVNKCPPENCVLVEKGASGIPGFFPAARFGLQKELSAYSVINFLGVFTSLTEFTGTGILNPRALRKVAL